MERKLKSEQLTDLARAHFIIKNLQQTVVIIAKNSQWCRVLSYSYFVPLISTNPLLANYVTTDPTFFVHLDCVQTEKILRREPHRVFNFLLRINSLIFNDEENASWAENTLRYLLLQNQEAKELMLNKHQFYDFLELNFLYFEENRSYAIEVLKDRLLCLEWLKCAGAYEHPLLKPQDYIVLSKWYAGDADLSAQYAHLATQSMKDVIDRMQMMTLSELTEDDLSPPTNSTIVVRQPSIINDENKEEPNQGYKKEEPNKLR